MVIFLSIEFFIDLAYWLHNNIGEMMREYGIENRTKLGGMYNEKRMCFWNT